MLCQASIRRLTDFLALADVEGIDEEPPQAVALASKLSIRLKERDSARVSGVWWCGEMAKSGCEEVGGAAENMKLGCESSCEVGKRKVKVTSIYDSVGYI